jgi:hypothetical protein
MRHWLKSNCHPEASKVILRLRMKKLFSIATAVVLLYSMYLPAWARDMEPTQAASCHRMPMQNATAQPAGKHARKHHCQEMDMAATQPSEGNSIAPSHSHSCPMNCCVQGTPTSGAAVAAIPLLPLLAGSEAEPRFAAIVFASAGFSSHTDRGPPVA